MAANVTTALAACNRNAISISRPYPNRSAKKLKKMIASPNPASPPPVIVPSSAWVNPYCWPQSLRIAPRTLNPMPAAIRVRKLAQNRIWLLKLVVGRAGGAAVAIRGHSGREGGGQTVAGRSRSYRPGPGRVHRIPLRAGYAGPRAAPYRAGRGFRSSPVRAAVESERVAAASARRRDVPMSDLNVLALYKGQDRFVFVYDDDSRAELLDAIRDAAADPRTALNWFDAAILTDRANQQAVVLPADAEEATDADIEIEGPSGEARF